MVEKKVEAFVVGTSHVSADSVERIKKTLDKFKPDVTCIELDEKRYDALVSGKTITLKDALKHKTMFMYVFSTLQQHVGKKAGNKPGTDMLMAAKLSKERKIPVALVDKDVKDISADIKKIPFKEKAKLLTALVSGVIIPQKDVDVKKIPTDKLIEQAMKEVKKISPTFYKVLVVERNHYMVDMIQRVIKDKKAKRIMVVVGAGHKREIASMLNKKKIKTKMT